jgi:hypothetical protein
MSEPITQPPYVDDDQCREAYIETVQAFFDTAGAARLEFCVYRWSQDMPIRPLKTVPVARVVMPINLARLLRDQLASMLEAADQLGKLASAPTATNTKN